MDSKTIRCSNCGEEVELLKKDEGEPQLICPLCSKLFPNPLHVQRKREAKKGLNRVLTFVGTILAVVLLYFKLQGDNSNKHDQNGTKGASEQNTDGFGKSCINGWSGGCKAIETYLRENMDDPDSYENIDTRFWDMNGYKIVVTKYRGKNVFGAKVVNVIKAKVSYDCQLIEIIETYP